jgi:hypothetical protein
MPTFTQDDPNTPAVIVKATASPPRQFGAPPRHGIGIRVEAAGLDTQAIQAGSAEDTAVQAVSQKGAALHAVSGPGAILGSLPLVDSSASGTTILSIATAANVNALWARNDAGGTAALFEGSVQIVNVDPRLLGADLGALTVKGTVRADGGETVAVQASSHRGPAVRGDAPQQNAMGFLAGPNPLAPQQTLGVFGQGDIGGVVGFSTAAGGIGVHGNSAAGAGTGVWGHTSTGIAVLGTSNASGAAGVFRGQVRVEPNELGPGSVSVQGNMTVSGDITTHDVTLSGGDCAEDFDIEEEDAVEPGTVMVVGDGSRLQPCEASYDKRVVGVIAGEGDLRPGIVLDRQRGAAGPRMPVALAGTVNCKADASYGAISVGDLLTTSPSAGHAMRAADSGQAFGAVIGKALGRLSAGQGMIPILVALQ